MKLEKILKLTIPLTLGGFVVYQLYQYLKEPSPEDYLIKLREEGL